MSRLLLFGVTELPSEVEDGGVCNSSDSLAEQLQSGDKLVWHMRHAQSTGNVAKEAARASDAGTGEKHHELEYQESLAYVDAPLSEVGLRQAEDACQVIATWTEKPSLIVCSPLTRSIQTAAIVFQKELLNGSAQLVIRPELRECWPDNNENMGRSTEELLACHRLRSLACWKHVEAAFSSTEISSWQHMWDTQWAKGSEGAWQGHIGDASRFEKFSLWLSQRSETKIAVVSHFGTVNQLLNREPWSYQRHKEEVPKAWGGQHWPENGLAKKFVIPNCGWIAVLMSPLQAANH